MKFCKYILVFIILISIFNSCIVSNDKATNKQKILVYCVYYASNAIDTVVVRNCNHNYSLFTNRGSNYLWVGDCLLEQTTAPIKIISFE